MARPMEDLRAACDGHTQRVGRRRRKAQREGALRLAKGLKQLLALARKVEQRQFLHEAIAGVDERRGLEHGQLDV